MTIAKSILTIRRDQSLQSTRTLILQHAGYMVSVALNQDAINFVGGPIPLGTSEFAQRCQGRGLRLSYAISIICMSAQQPSNPTNNIGKFPAFINI